MKSFNNHGYLNQTFVSAESGELLCPKCKKTFRRPRHFNTHRCLGIGEYRDILRDEVLTDDELEPIAEKTAAPEETLAEESPPEPESSKPERNMQPPLLVQ